MDLLASSPSTSERTNDSASLLGGRGSDRSSSMVTDLVDKVLCLVVTSVFTVAGSLAGAVTGAVIGLATESGLVRGAAVGAISGAVFSIEVVESSLDLWHSSGSSIGSVLYVIDIVISLLSGRLVQEKVGPAVQSAVQSQMSAIDIPFIEDLDIFEIDGPKGMSKDSISNLPKIKITTSNNVDAYGEKICCTVCLQDIQITETARSLPHCGHMFHLPCIDTWLIRHGSCPLCRRDI